MKLKSLPSQFAAMLITTALLTGLTSGCGSKINEAERAAVAAAPNWLMEIDNGQYGQSWLEASVFFQDAVPEQKWESSMTTYRKPLGDLVSRNFRSAHYATQLPGAPAGQYVVMQFDTSFANKKSAIETVTFMLEKDGQWKSSGYYIK